MPERPDHPLHRPETLPVHLGFVTHDLEHGMARLAEVFPVAWGDPVRFTREVTAGGRTRTWEAEVVKSAPGPGQIELLRGEPGSVWHVPDGVAFHHYAYASSDVNADAAALERSGWTVEVAGSPPYPASTFAYLIKPGAARVELYVPR